MSGFWRTFGNMWRPLARSSFMEEQLERERRSLRLLVSHLSPAQREQFARHEYFDVVVGETGTRYRIHNGRVFNVVQLNANGARDRLLCFEPKGTLPIGDVMLAQKLALELFEARALQVANVLLTWMTGPGADWARLNRRRHLH